MNYSARGCMYCEGVCNKECLPKQEKRYSEEEAKQLAFDFYSEMSRAMKVPDYMITDSTILLERKFNQYKK